MLFAFRILIDSVLRLLACWFVCWLIRIHTGWFISSLILNSQCLNKCIPQDMWQYMQYRLKNIEHQLTVLNTL